MNELTRLANYHYSDKGTTTESEHGFTEIYEQFFVNLKEQTINILEVGVNHGASLRMYYDYFPNAQIVGLDITDKKQYENDRIKCYIVDQSNKEQLSKFVSEIDMKFDIIIDDGSHHMADQQITFYYLSKILKNGGIFIIEDLHTSLADDKTPLYGKLLEIMPDYSNTTLSYLLKKPLKSVYLDNHQNESLETQYGDDIYIFERENSKVGVTYGSKSITSILLKKHIV
jgi:SAM-dependent methyltransferase